MASAPDHSFYVRRNELLEAEQFDKCVEERCAKLYASPYGRPSLTPGIYFRSLLIGFFGGIDSELRDYMASGGLASATEAMDRFGDAWRNLLAGWRTCWCTVV